MKKERTDEERDKTTVKFCPCCGLRPEYGVEKPGRHIYSLHCGMCQARFVIHVNK